MWRPSTESCSTGWDHPCDPIGHSASLPRPAQSFSFLSAAPHSNGTITSRVDSWLIQPPTKSPIGDWGSFSQGIGAQGG